MAIYNFVDAQQMHKEHPDTFEVPTEEEINALRIGDYVKVCHNNERFWIHLLKVEDKKLTGKVDNMLIEKQPFECGSVVTCEKQHIYSIMKHEESV